jgi:hypothetical protein
MRSDNRIINRFARDVAGCNAHDSVPVVVVPGNSSPRVAGRSYHWTTLSGKTEVRHPNAYGWPTLYHASTRRVVVGASWLDSAISAIG